MPRLIDYVSFGICSGYGDADYRVSAAVADLSPEAMKELRLAGLYAIYAMEEMWRRAQESKQPLQASASPSEG